MQEKEDEQEQKHPSEMTADEAVDGVFAPEITEAPGRKASKYDEPEIREPDCGD